MTLPRTLEPEVMETAESADEYDRMNHAAVNRLFAEDVAHRMHRLLIEGQSWPRVLDVGTGTAWIPLELACAFGSCRIVGVDASAEMLAVGQRNLDAAQMNERISLRQADAKSLPFADGEFPVVVSNSLIHHIPEPLAALREMKRVLKPGGLLFVRDLFRPDSAAEVDRLVALHAADASPHQRQLFHDSLHAALTVNEVRAMLAELGLPETWVQQTSDRHWTLTGQIRN